MFSKHRLWFQKEFSAFLQIIFWSWNINQCRPAAQNWSWSDAARLQRCETDFCISASLNTPTHKGALQLEKSYPLPTTLYNCKMTSRTKWEQAWIFPSFYKRERQEINNSQFENKPVQSTKLWRGFFKLFMSLFRPWNLHTIILKKDKGWWLIYVFSQSERKISVLTSTLSDFTLLLMFQSYTEDYQQDKEPKEQFTIFHLHVICIVFPICCILSHLWMLQQYLLSDTLSICPF